MNKLQSLKALFKKSFCLTFDFKECKTDIKSILGNFNLFVYIKMRLMNLNGINDSLKYI